MVASTSSQKSKKARRGSIVMPQGTQIPLAQTPKPKRTMLGSGKIISLVSKLLSNINPSSPRKVLPEVLTEEDKEEQAIQEHEKKSLNIILDYTKQQHILAVQRNQGRKPVDESNGADESLVEEEEDSIPSPKLKTKSSLNALFPIEPIKLKGPPERAPNFYELMHLDDTPISMPTRQVEVRPKKVQLSPQQIARITHSLLNGSHKDVTLEEIMALEQLNAGFVYEM